ncbi:hypothetical protein TSUD_246250 [Trifolium subterraneum]|uniref:FBD domain-containing protein n=1 Tax=Trifolium subterraneum TaxID=3900 RepID=A0A2Z6PGE1_TRISU|nr:hypothetical protein TSUD_246250 [Trifolium subterraneum]
MSPTIDRISSLPDEILCHILSSLPTKLAFSTIILSKRWAPLYKLLTSIHLEDESVSDEDSFLRFCSIVDTVTLSTRLIKTFRLKCHSIHWRDDRFNVDSWMETVKQHPVENLYISTTLAISLEIFLPQSIFIFPTLVFLKLDRVKVAGNISVDLPSLKTLHLLQFYLKNHQNFIKLLNGCPIIEDLIVHVFYIDNDSIADRVRTKEFKTLSKLIRADIHECDVPISAIDNVKNLKLGMWGRHSEPETNSYFRGFLVCQNLIQLELCFHRFHHWDNVVEVLQNCPKLQILSFEKWPYSCYNKDDLNITWKDPTFVPECISSRLKSCIIDYKGKVDELQFASYILQNAQVLEVMKIMTRKYGALKNREALDQLTFCPRISPYCKLSIF